ncbi:glyoxylase-like metal-dependent hydrolase (beta-lactamase superfamily II) [Crossiella equi]|uniref:Glyoxylase-like metal-dependent hydrolase (Beta-lactamase superfamily II) n=1 Tax=Crossiella equi TaxID=130796 RepID=A0ABS5AH59_9PSEU|nr:MBL fold metallo-hydrolase [Crossiella equi]MBP2475906.1 glyoxylase-like metal-dependent hydrolase (beta-lactamase superfamily II) [Crossiella equi]
MRVHHLNCATMTPLGGRWINGDAPPHRAARLVAHVLLVETEQGLVLVDSGLGLTDVRNPARLGALFKLTTRPRLVEAETAVRQVVRLGYSPEDVRHIVLTHLDVDHAGGISDFPHAKVHVHEDEYEAAMARRTVGERGRYVPAQWAHGPDWARYTAREGDRWFGFEAVRQLDGLPPEILLIPLAGHTHGHSGVAVAQPGDRWLLHAGDAYFFRGEVNARPSRGTPGLDLFQSLVEINRTKRLDNQRRLHALASAEAGRIQVFSAHDPTEFERCREGVV